jgi:23S rRNA pseudouridine1911/1915/1917 synthase
VTLERQALHAAMLGFVHPIIEDYMQFESELPSDMRRILEAFT